MKKNQNFNRICIFSVGFILIITFTVSCKFNQKTGNNDSNDHIGNMTFSKERPFIKSELDIGRRICSALKQKRDTFKNHYNDKTEKFRFQGTLVDCQGTTTLDTPFDAFILNASALEYSATIPRENYFRDIVTDQSGAMNDLCVSLSASDNVLNTFKLDKVRYTVSFLVAENYDRFDVRKELSDNQGLFSIAGAESILVVTHKSQADSKFFGVEKERIRYTSCEGKKYQTMKQTWKEALTKF